MSYGSIEPSISGCLKTSQPLRVRDLSNIIAIFAFAICLHQLLLSGLVVVAPQSEAM